MTNSTMISKHRVVDTGVHTPNSLLMIKVGTQMSRRLELITTSNTHNTKMYTKNSNMEGLNSSSSIINKINNNNNNNSSTKM